MVPRFFRLETSSVGTRSQGSRSLRYSGPCFRYCPCWKLSRPVHPAVVDDNSLGLQFTTVLGVTKTRGFLHPDQHILNATQNSLCSAVNRRRGRCACRASNCRRRASFRGPGPRDHGKNLSGKARIELCAKSIHSKGVRRFGEAQSSSAGPQARDRAPRACAQAAGCDAAGRWHDASRQRERLARAPRQGPTSRTIGAMCIGSRHRYRSRHLYSASASRGATTSSRQSVR
jgi:hypothetical protein